MAIRQKILCPFCGQEDAIIQFENERKFNNHPIAGVTAIIGNFDPTIDVEFDFSHANVCPSNTMRYAIHKEALLAYHVGHLSEKIPTDTHSFEEWQKEIRRLGLDLRTDLFRENNKWKYVFSIKRCFIEGLSLQTFASTPDTAFYCLRHRLFCGEPLDSNFQIRIKSSVLFELEDIKIGK